MTIKDIRALYYALENAHHDVMAVGFGNSSARDRICFYMNYKDYCRLCGLIDQVIGLDNGKTTLFGHEIKIRDELKHIYLGIEMDEVKDNERNT